MHHRDALIEHEALAVEAALGFGDRFEIFEDAALEVEHLLEPLLEHIGRGLLAANAAGAEHRDLRMLGRIEPRHVILELGKALRLGIAGIAERAELHLVVVAGIDQRHVVAADQPVPVAGLDIGAAELARVGFGGAERHDLGLQPDLHPEERHLGGGREFRFGAGKPAGPQRRRLEPGHQLVDRLGRAGDRAVDPLRRQDEGATDAAGAAEQRQLRLQRRTIFEIGKLVERQHLETVQAFGQIGGGFLRLDHCGRV